MWTAPSLPRPKPPSLEELRAMHRCAQQERRDKINCALRTRKEIRLQEKVELERWIAQRQQFRREYREMLCSDFCSVGSDTDYEEQIVEQIEDEERALKKWERACRKDDDDLEWELWKHEQLSRLEQDKEAAFEEALRIQVEQAKLDQLHETPDRPVNPLGEDDDLMAVSDDGSLSLPLADAPVLTPRHDRILIECSSVLASFCRAQQRQLQAQRPPPPPPPARKPQRTEVRMVVHQVAEDGHLFTKGTEDALRRAENYQWQQEEEERMEWYRLSTMKVDGVKVVDLEEKWEEK